MTAKHAGEALDGEREVEAATVTEASDSDTNSESKAASQRKRPTHLWVKGQSGNPGGRPKAEAAIREMAREYGPRAIKRLAELMRSKNERVAVAACQALLDRGFGKPLLAVTTPGGGPLVNINMNSNSPLTPSEAYRLMLGNPATDTDALLARVTPALEQNK